MPGSHDSSSPRLRGMNALGQRQANKAAILEAVFRYGPVDQTALGRLTGLAGGSVSRIVAELIGEGLLRLAQAASSAASAPGRPRVPLDLDLDGGIVLSVHIGARVASVGVHNLRGRLIDHRDVTFTSAEDVQDVGRRLFGLLGALVAEKAPEARLLGTGVSIAGQVGSATVALEHPTLKVTRRDLEGLGASLGFGPVYVESLMYGLASAETWFGRYAGQGNVALVHIGNTVGSAIVVDGQSGSDQAIVEGRLGHLSLPGGTRLCACGRRGCFQAEITDEAAANRFREVLGTGETRLDQQHDPAAESFDVITAAYRRAEAGDHAAQELFREWASGIADVARVVLAVASTKRLLLVGRTVTRCAELLVPLVNEHLGQGAPEVPQVGIGSFGDYPALTSAAALVLRRFFGTYSEPSVPGIRHPVPSAGRSGALEPATKNRQQ